MLTSVGHRNAHTEGATKVTTEGINVGSIVAIHPTFFLDHAPLIP